MRALTPPLLRAESLVKTYAAKGRHAPVRALDSVSLEVRRGATLGIVGESGSGKSTLAQCLALLEKPTSGRIWLGDQELTALRGRDLRKQRARVQLIFQDASAAMNPRWNALEIVSEPLLFCSRMTREERWMRAGELMGLVGLHGAGARRLAEFSGGQRQRLAIARALAATPEVLILDESLSSLDCSVQAQIANLLVELQSEKQLAMIFISHDLAMAAHLADEIVVMAHGSVVESGPAREIVRSAAHPVTREMVASMPRLPQSAAAVLQEA